MVECLLEVVGQTVDGDREEDVAQLKTASDLMVLLLLGGNRDDAGAGRSFFFILFFKVTSQVGVST